MASLSKYGKIESRIEFILVYLFHMLFFCYPQIVSVHFCVPEVLLRNVQWQTKKPWVDASEYPEIHINSNTYNDLMSAKYPIESIKSTVA